MNSSSKLQKHKRSRGSSGQNATTPTARPRALLLLLAAAVAVAAPAAAGYAALCAARNAQRSVDRAARLQAPSPKRRLHHYQQQQQQQQGQQAGLLVDSVAADRAPHGGPARGGDAADAALWRWLADGGARVAFEPGYAGNGARGGFATHDIPAGGELLRLPMQLTFQFATNWTSFVEPGEALALEASKPDSPWRAYFATVPGLLADDGDDPAASGALSWENFPHNELEMLQAPPLAALALAKQAAIDKHYARRAPALAAAGVTRARLVGALVAMSTRWFTGPDDAPASGGGGGRRAPMLMVPAFDLLNHVNGCPIHYTFEPCADGGGNGTDSGDGERCLVARTGRAYRAGDEVCNSYSWLAPDHALMQYGFLLPEVAAADGVTTSDSSSSISSISSSSSSISSSSKSSSNISELPPLSLVDAPGFKPSDLLASHAGPPARLDAKRAPRGALEAERARLAGALVALRAADGRAARAAAESAAPGVAAMVLKWRGQRARALEAEVARLDRALMAADASAAAAPS